MPIQKSTLSACSLSACALPLPQRDKNGRLRFAKCIPEFAPNLTPEEVLRLGSFGGGYFRDITSQVTKQTHARTWEELPSEWLEGLDIPTQVASETYRKNVNHYGVRCGVTLGKGDAFGLLAWEDKGWMSEQDPYGWFQWYCRFYLGRRSDDDDRQIGRWLGVCGSKGRWKNNLIAQCVKAGKDFDDVTVSPVVRQTLQHWAYRLTSKDFDEYAAKVRAGAKTAFIPGGTVQVLGQDPVENADRGKARPTGNAGVEKENYIETPLSSPKAAVKRQTFQRRASRDYASKPTNGDAPEDKGKKRRKA